MVFLTTDFIHSADRKGNYCPYFRTSKTHGVRVLLRSKELDFACARPLVQFSIHVFSVYNWYVKFSSYVQGWIDDL